MSSSNNIKPKIAFIDSGVGGLSIVSEFAKTYQGRAELAYFLDQEGYPYGSKDESFLCYHLLKYLKKVRGVFDFDLLVVACNTASTVALELIRKEISCPIVGVVPAIKVAADLKECGVKAILVTELSSRQGYLQRLINDFGEHQESFRIVPCQGLVGIAESYLLFGRIENDLLARELEPLKQIPNLSSVVLGCTHFPILKNQIAQILGEKVKIIDSNSAVAKRIAALLNLQVAEGSKFQSVEFYNSKTSYHGFSYFKITQKTGLSPSLVTSFNLN